MAGVEWRGTYRDAHDRKQRRTNCKWMGYMFQRFGARLWRRGHPTLRHAKANTRKISSSWASDFFFFFFYRGSSKKEEQTLVRTGCSRLDPGWTAHPGRKNEWPGSPRDGSGLTSRSRQGGTSGRRARRGAGRVYFFFVSFPAPPQTQKKSRGCAIRSAGRVPGLVCEGARAPGPFAPNIAKTKEGQTKGKGIVQNPPPSERPARKGEPSRGRDENPCAWRVAPARSAAPRFPEKIGDRQ